MSEPGLKLGKYSVGTGDRFAHQAKAQLQACILAEKKGIIVNPVWNKSNREHIIVGSEPASVRLAADAAVKELKWKHAYFCDADHINLDTFERFLEACDFYTLDVADYIGQHASAAEIDAFVSRHPELLSPIKLDGIDEVFNISKDDLRKAACKYLFAVKQAGMIFSAIEKEKGAGNFIPEVSMDETDAPQTPVELLIILAAIADEAIPIQTIAPKFSGRFNKGVDYIGNVATFAREFDLDAAAIAWAVRQFRLPANLKLSVHSGSDKFSIYPAIHASMKKFNAGVHLKTAGTTWLEELVGLAEAGGDGLAVAKEVYAEAFAHQEEFCKPYTAVIDIDAAKLPTPSVVRGWTSEQYTSALRHVPGSPEYNSSLRQLLHVGFKVAAKMGLRYLDLLEANEEIIAKNVTENLVVRHIAPVFLGRQS